MPPVTGFILAGGRSRRMGTDKALLPWGEGTLLDHMTRTLRPVADPVRIVGRGPLPDRRPGRGPVEGIATALEATATEDNLIVAVDLPHLKPAFLGHLAERLNRSETGFVVCTCEGRTPLSIGLRRDLGGAVDQYLESGGRSIEGLLAAMAHDAITGDELRAAGFPPDMFRNLNTLEDYRRSPGR